MPHTSGLARMLFGCKATRIISSCFHFFDYANHVMDAEWWVTRDKKVDEAGRGGGGGGKRGGGRKGVC